MLPDLPPTKFDVIRGAYWLIVAIVATLLAIVLVAAGMCAWHAVKTGDLSAWRELRLGDYLFSAMGAVMALFGLNRAAATEK